MSRLERTLQDSSAHPSPGFSVTQEGDREGSKLFVAELWTLSGLCRQKCIGTHGTSILFVNEEAKGKLHL